MVRSASNAGLGRITESDRTGRKSFGFRRLSNRLGFTRITDAPLQRRKSHRIPAALQIWLGGEPVSPRCQQSGLFPPQSLEHQAGLMTHGRVNSRVPTFLFGTA
jgi:hypothetical protein